eukprot:1230841-Amphidinium_carterae.1
MSFNTIGFHEMCDTPGVRHCVESCEVSAAFDTCLKSLEQEADWSFTLKTKKSRATMNIASVAKVRAAVIDTGKVCQNLFDMTMGKMVQAKKDPSATKKTY